MQENKGISIVDAFMALEDIDDEVVAQEVKTIKRNKALKESLKEEKKVIKLDISGDNMYDKGQAYFYARTGDHVDINGVKYEIIEDREHKIGYSDEILLKNLETGETTLIAKKDFIKDAQLLKEGCVDCKEEVEEDDGAFSRGQGSYLLPKEVIFTASEVALDTDDEDPEERLSDLLSDRYGYCHFGFKYEVKNNENGEPSEFRCYDIEWDTSESLKEKHVCEKCGKNPCECVEESCEVKEDNKAVAIKEGLKDDIENRVEELRDSCKDMSRQELLDSARNEHTYALGSKNSEEATMHEINADAYRILAKEKEGLKEDDGLGTAWFNLVLIDPETGDWYQVEDSMPERVIAAMTMTLQDCLEYFQQRYDDKIVDIKKAGWSRESLEESKLDEMAKLPYHVLAWKLNEIIASMNHEGAYYDSGWLYIWPDGETQEDCREDFNDKESYEELRELFEKVYKRYHKDGLYTSDQRIVDYAHAVDQKLGLEPIQNLGKVKAKDNEGDDPYAYGESLKENVKVEEEKIDEAPISTLEPEFDSRKSFYKKAIVDERPDGTKILYSYDTPVAMIKNGEVTLGKMTNRGYPFAVWNYSQTTLRHVKEFLKQNGFTADSTKQMAQDYKCDFIRESLSEDLKLDLTANNKEEIVEKGREALEKSEDEPELQVVDVNADTVEDLKDDYVGDIILKCNKCGFVFFKDKEDIVKDEKTGLYNIEDTCSHCGAKEGFKLGGQVASADVDAEKADEQDLTKDAPKEEETIEVEKEETLESPVEGVEEENKKTTLIATESLDTRSLVEKLEDFDEVSFDKLVNKYFNKVFENVESYKTTNCKFENNSILVEGTIKFKSGKEKATAFKLSENKQNKHTVRFDCVNESLANQDKAFSLVGKVLRNRLMCESFSCNYKVKKLDEELLVRERFGLKEKKVKKEKEVK